MTTISSLGLGQRGFYFGLGLAVGLGFAVHGAAASSVSTPCRNGGTTKAPVAVVRPAHSSALLVKDQHRWWLSVTRVAVVPQVKGDLGTYRAHGKYLVVFLTAQNVGKVPQDLYFDQDFALTDAQGRQFGLAESGVQIAAVGQYKINYASEDVQPTFGARVAFVFDVATDARGLALVNVPSFGDTTQRLFPLGI